MLVNRPMPFRAVRLTLPALLLLVPLAAACGSASTITPTAKTAGPRPARHLNATHIAQTRVTDMVLTTDSPFGYKLHSKGSETLKEQLPPKRLPHAAVVRRLVKANWIASEHSFVVGPDGKLYLYSDVNLFRTGAAAARISGLEAVAIPGMHEKMYPTPTSAPPGSRLEFERASKLSSFTLGWAQGPVIAFVRVFGHEHERITPAQEHRIASYLAQVAKVQAARIRHADAMGDLSA